MRGFFSETKELFGSLSGGKHAYEFPRAFLAFVLGGICCSIRFTCLAAFVPLGLILAIQRRRTSVVSIMVYLILVCASAGLLGLTLTILLDRFMYGFWAIPFLGNIHFNVILGGYHCRRMVSLYAELVRLTLLFFINA